MIELYIENKKIDITDDLEINFTYETIDPDKLSSIKNSFSKTVNIPGTANNNITFGHIFRYDKYIPVAGPTNIDSFYDPHKRVEWFINKNGSVINRGYCTLDNILVKSERDITYQFTLYGGIGEFFYSLTYNEDGSPKTLADLYWNWFPKVGLVGHSTQTTITDENSRTLYKCSADIIAQSYHTLNPHYTYSGTTEIEKDVVFVPCYTGLYEDFDSKHMLVSTFNQDPNYITTNGLSNDNKLKLQRAFPDSITDGDKTYTTLGSTFSSSDTYRYGLVTFSRDIDPWEAGDIRINEMPVAIRLSKLMNVISQPENNGRYEVEWDDEITNSYHWLYSWVMLGKIKQEYEDFNIMSFSPSTEYDGQYTTINVDWQTGEGDCVRTATSYDLPQSSNSINKGKYTLYLNVNPNLTVRCADFDYWAARYNDYISGSMHDSGSIYRYIWTTPVLVHKIYDGSTLIKTIADVFYFSTDPNTYIFGYNKKNVPIEDIKEVLNGMINLNFMGSGEFIDQFNYHNCKLENPEVTGEGYIKTVLFNCENERITTTLDINSDITDLRIEQSQGIMWTNLMNTSPITSGLYGVDDISFNIRTSGSSNSPSRLPLSAEAPYGFITSSKYSVWPYNMFSLQANQNNSWAYFNLNDSLQNGITNTKDSGFNIMNLNKKTLFAQSQSPMKYLSGFCKLMNYKFICNETEKKIQIKILKNYYIDKTNDLNERVDIGRDINIKNITTKYKTINIGLETPDSYPVYIFNKNSRDKFNTFRKDTGIRYNATETNLLNDLIFKNTIDWQQSSIYYNLNPQLPRPYNVASISWTLFNKDATNVDNIEKKEFFTVGTPSTDTSLLPNKDFMPKIALFDKDNKTVDFESSLIFLNGFVRNYDYTEVPNSNMVEIQPDSTNPSHYISSSGVVATTQYQDIYIYNVRPNTQYFVTASFTSSYGSYTVNYYDASGTRIGTEYSQSNANLVDAGLNIPQNTATIRCNFRKADANAKMKVIAPNYVISPRVNFSNDTVEQIYFNGSRCYLYDFKYTDNFTTWGCWSSDKKGSASSWIIPMFSRDLYNQHSQDFDIWEQSNYKLASWNIVDQFNLDSIYDLLDTTFIYDNNFEFSKNIDSTTPIDYNEYSIGFVPADNSNTYRIYDKNWKDYINDLYDRNARDITAYVDLSGFGDANSIMRYIYSYKSHLWIITKLENFKIAETVHDKFTKVTMHKIQNKYTWTE